MRSFIIAVLVSLTACSIGHAQISVSHDDYPTISVNGEAVVNVVPDKIIITLGVETWDKNINTAKEKNNDILEEAIARIRRADVADKNIQTDHLSIEPRYKDSYRKEDFLGYFVRNTLAVTITDVKKVEEIITRVLEVGVNYIHGIDFQTTEFKKYREQARELALLAAKEKAEKMAAVLGGRIGAPLRINENYSGSPMSYWSGWGHGRASGMSQNVMQNIPGGVSEISETVALGKISVRAAVSVTFSLVN